VTGVAPVAGVLLGALALLAGYLVGSLPAAPWIGRMAGIDPADVDLAAAGIPGGGPAAVWRLAGPGWGFLALTAELAKGVVPVAVGVVTFSWAIGWVAGLGAVLGAGWPAFGRAAGDRGLGTFGGASFTLAPPAGMLSVLLGLGVLAFGRLAGRDARAAAIATGLATFPLLFLLAEPDLARVAAILALTGVLIVRLATIRGS
jgi:acyl phosphate:glycerol-3-phosphate acyltransferase